MPVLLTGGLDDKGSSLDVLVVGETIAAVGSAAAADPRSAGAHRVDLAGHLLLPAAAEPHAHLDKALLRGRAPNREGTLDGALEAMRGVAVTSDDILERARQATATALRRGFTAIRTHVDVGGPAGTAGVEALARLRDELRGLVDIQIAVLVAGQLNGRDAQSLRQRVRVALGLGCDVVGGAPWRGTDPARSIDELTAVAADVQLPVDLHLDETTDANVLTVARYAERVAALGLGGRATASHCVSLGQQDPARARSLARELAACGVALIVLPQTNLALQGRGLATRAPRALPPLAVLEEAGVLVAAGGDNWQDPFNPVGRIDPMETASLLAAAGHLDPRHAYALVSSRAREVLGMPAALLQAGDAADFLAIRAGDLTEAVAGGTEDRMVWRRGRLVARTTVRWETGTVDTGAGEPGAAGT
jgi:cytosine deaminase